MQNERTVAFALLTVCLYVKNTERTHCCSKVTLYKAVRVKWTCLPTPQRYIIQNPHCLAYYKNFSEISKPE